MCCCCCCWGLVFAVVVVVAAIVVVVAAVVVVLLVGTAVVVVVAASGRPKYCSAFCTSQCTIADTVTAFHTESPVSAFLHRRGVTRDPWTADLSTIPLRRVTSTPRSALRLALPRHEGMPHVSGTCMHLTPSTCIILPDPIAIA